MVANLSTCWQPFGFFLASLATVLAGADVACSPRLLLKLFLAIDQHHQQLQLLRIDCLLSIVTLFNGKKN